MSIESELQRIVEAKLAMIQAIIDKGVTVPEDAKLEDLPALIDQIEGDTPTPVGLPANTLRFRFSNSNYDPTTARTDQDEPVGGKGTWTKVEGVEDNEWDWTCNNNNWGSAFYRAFMSMFGDDANFVSIIDAGDTSSVTATYYMFYMCPALEHVCLFDTSNVTDMESMFDLPDENGPGFNEIPLFDTSKVTCFKNFLNGHFELKEIPLFNTSSAEEMDYAFCDCWGVEHGALALYQQMVNQPNPPTSYVGTFAGCGSDTQTGAAELAQIPDDWKSYD